MVRGQPVYVVFTEDEGDATPITVSVGEESGGRAEEIAATARDMLSRVDAPGVQVEGPQMAVLRTSELPNVGFGAANYVLVICPRGTMSDVFTSLGQSGLFR